MLDSFCSGNKTAIEFAEKKFNYFALILKKPKKAAISIKNTTLAVQKVANSLQLRANTIFHSQKPAISQFKSQKMTQNHPIYFQKSAK